MEKDSLPPASPVLSGTAASAPQPDAQALATQIEQLQKSVQSLDEKLTHVQKEVAPQTIPRTTPRSQKEIQDAKWTSAGVASLAVGKVAAIFAAKLSFIYEAGKLILNKESIFNVLENKQDFWNHPLIMRPSIWGMVAGVAAMIPGAMLGYMRGERLENAKALWKEPIRSLKILLGFSEGYKDPEPISAPQTPHQQPLAEHHAAQPQTNWQKREDMLRSQASEAAHTVARH
jgi:hypothetical protein